MAYRLDDELDPLCGLCARFILHAACLPRTASNSWSAGQSGPAAISQNHSARVVAPHVGAPLTGYFRFANA